MATAYPGQGEVLSAEPVTGWIDRSFLRPDPYAFRDGDFRAFVARVCDELGVYANGVFCIGSGAVGLSLNPDKIAGGVLKAFDEESDLDLAVVSEVHFEQAWRDLREHAQPTVDTPQALASALSWQRKRFFDGAILAHVLLPFLSFGEEWLFRRTRLAEHVSVVLEREIEVNMWIYRDYWSLRNYVAQGIVNCQKGVLNA